MSTGAPSTGPTTHRPLLARVRPAHWLALDTALAGVYALLTFMLLAKHSHGLGEPLAALAGALAPAWPIAWRRRRPLGAFYLLLAVLGVFAALAPRSIVAALVPLAYVLYVVAANCRPRSAVLALVTALAAATTTALPDFHHRGAAVFFALAYTAVWTIGYAVGMHRRYTADLLRSQAELAEARVEQARRDITAQRMGIARELHDVVAHHMSVITIQAGYGGLMIDQSADSASPDPARSTLGIIESTGRLALSEMRNLVGVLRADPGDEQSPEPDLAPTPGLADLGQLIEHAAHAGVQVNLTVTGSPQPLPPGEDLSAYRVIQEALTNVIKHAGTETARARIDYGDAWLTIEVCNDASATAQPTDAAPPGRGLAGMRERALLYGGDLHAGPTQSGGFLVTARLPLPPTAAAEPSS
ncbi:sensor histidine kinase [Actinocrinis sp.]|uniref:sensor histidine kinase n=1 Tax=Actinocrinis sp. TaxID=1920516 RepID=UPI002D45C08A|nr:histidine kinase [Actinocrinis sp.]HZP54228.1 histidine kinase [Actinocrinis sp.]